MRTYYAIWHIAVCIAMVYVCNMPACSNGCLQCLGDAKNTCVDRTGLWLTQATSSPQTYTYEHELRQPTSDHIRCMTFNIQRYEPATRRWFQLWWGGRPWFQPNRLWRIRDVIRQAAPHILSLQEIHPSMLVGLLDMLPSRYAVSETNQIAADETLTNPILYDANRCTIQNISVIPMDRGMAPVVRAQYHDDSRNRMFTIVNAHLDPYTGYQTLNEVTARARRHNEPCYVMGDFNTDVSQVPDRLDNMDLASSSTIPTYIPWTAEHEHQGSSIDGIYYYNSGNDIHPIHNTVAVFQGEVSHDGRMHPDHRASDHRPVIADFTQ